MPGAFLSDMNGHGKIQVTGRALGEQGSQYSVSKVDTVCASASRGIQCVPRLEA